MRLRVTGVPDPVAVAERGLAVFPLPPGGRRPTPGWQRRCVADPAVLRQLWRPGDNVGVGCRASNLVGVDLDRRPDVDGVAMFAALCGTHGQDWPGTFAVRTPHGGLHLYFRAPAGQVVTSASGALGPGIDVRGPGRRGGGYLVGPGSVVGGATYAVERDAGIQSLPAWLAGLLALPRSAPIGLPASTNLILRRSPW